MDLPTVRDWVLIIAGVLWAVVTLAIAAVCGVLWFLTRKYLRKGDDLLTAQVRPRLDQVHSRLAAVRDRTSRLPGNAPIPEAAARPLRSGSGLSLPWRRRKRGWLRR